MNLSRSTMIAAPAGRIFDFFENMEANYTRWHPDHITFRWLGESRQEVGSRFYFEERIHGQHLKRIMRYTAVKPGRLIEFVPDSALIRFFLRYVRFEIVSGDEGCRFTQSIRIRIGPVGRWLNRRGFEAVEKHMREEGANLRAMMETR